MSDEPTDSEPSRDPTPETPVATPARTPVRSRARDVGLAAIAFAATLVLLLGATQLVERGGTAAGPSSSGGVPSGPSASNPPATRGSPSSSDGRAATADPSPGASAGPSTTPSAAPTASPAGDPVLVGAGDIADCASSGAEDTATLLDAIEGTVFTVGDNAYEDGTADQFRDCYDPTWGRHLGRTRPAPGNHDWGTPRLAGYRDYFGAAAQGPDGASWYSYDLGAWHVIVLDSECDEVEGCGPSSPQGEWLAADLGASDATCTMAIFHVPRFSSGAEHGSAPEMDAFWRPLYAAGVDVIVNGHDHDYERFAPQDPDGREDLSAGIREFVVGTGGAPLREFGPTVANSQLRALVGHGVIAFTLHDAGYAWAFVAAGNAFRDRGTANCH